MLEQLNEILSSAPILRKPEYPTPACL